MRAELPMGKQRAFPPRREGDADSFGAEAIPGGLVGFNDARGGAPAAPGARIVGLIALATHWMRKRGERP